MQLAFGNHVNNHWMDASLTDISSLHGSILRGSVYENFFDFFMNLSSFVEICDIASFC